MYLCNVTAFSEFTTRYRGFITSLVKGTAAQFWVVWYVYPIWCVCLLMPSVKRYNFAVRVLHKRKNTLGNFQNAQYRHWNANNAGSIFVTDLRRYGSERYFAFTAYLEDINSIFPCILLVIPCFCIGLQVPGQNERIYIAV